MDGATSIKKQNALLKLQSDILRELHDRQEALVNQIKESYQKQKDGLKGVTDGTKSQEKATQAVTETLKKQADVVDKNKQKLRLRA